MVLPSSVTCCPPIWPQLFDLRTFVPYQRHYLRHSMRIGSLCHYWGSRSLSSARFAPFVVHPSFSCPLLPFLFFSVSFPCLPLPALVASNCSLRIPVSSGHNAWCLTRTVQTVSQRSISRSHLSLSRAVGSVCCLAVSVQYYSSARTLAYAPCFHSTHRPPGLLTHVTIERLRFVYNRMVLWL